MRQVSTRAVVCRNSWISMPSPFTSRQVGNGSGGNGCFDLWAFFFEAVGVNTGFALHARVMEFVPPGLTDIGGAWVPRADAASTVPQPTNTAVPPILPQIRCLLIDLRLTEFKYLALRRNAMVFTIC